MNEQDIFLAALEISDVNERAQFLDRACGNDSALRKQVESLLRVHDRQGEFLGTPVLQQLADQAATPHKPVATSEKQDSRSNNTQNECNLSFLEPSTAPGSLGRLQHFEICQVIGRGAFGIVLKAFDAKLHRVVAIKVMTPELAATSPARKRFLREARSAAAVRHENVVSIYAVEDQPLPFLVMEFIDGRTLQQKLDQTGPLEIIDILKIGRQVAKGLEAAHEKGLIHRDIKPANILLESGSERVILTDFGLARAADDASLTQSGFIAGTPLYMSPEQAQGRKIDSRSDLFSLGSVLYVMCSGRPPFRAPSTIAVIRRVVEDEPRPIQEIISEVPVWMVKVIARLHAKNPDERFTSALEIATLLDHCLTKEMFPYDHPVTQPGFWQRLLLQLQNTPLLISFISLLLITGVGLALFLAGNEMKPDAAQRAETMVSSNAKPVLQVQEMSGQSSVDRAKQSVSAMWTPDAEQNAFFLYVKNLPVELQASTVGKKLQEINPDFDGKFSQHIEEGQVVSFTILTDHVTKIWPVRALLHLRKLQCGGSWTRNGKLVDISPLAGMSLNELHVNSTQVADLSPVKGMPLTTLNSSHTRVADLTPLQGMKLHTLRCADTQVKNLSPLAGMSLTQLSCNDLPISDLTPLHGMPLTELWCQATSVTALSPLAGMPLKFLCCERLKIEDVSPLKGMPLSELRCHETLVTDYSPLLQMPLKTLSFDIQLYDPDNQSVLESLPVKGVIDGWPPQPTAQFRMIRNQRRQAAESFVEKLANRSSDELVVAVTERLQQLNGGDRGNFKCVIVDDQVLEATLAPSAFLRDLTPLMAFKSLKKLTIRGGVFWLDMSCLKDLPLEELVCQRENVIKNYRTFQQIPTLQKVTFLDPAVSADQLSQVKAMLPNSEISLPSHAATVPSTRSKSSNTLPSPQSVAPQTSRQIAEWVLSKNGRATIKVGQKKMPCTQRPLPTEDFVVTGIHLMWRADVVDADLERLRNCPDLEELELMGCEQLTDQGILNLPDLQKLQRIVLCRNMKLTGRCLSRIASFTNLKDLDLNHSVNISLSGFANFGELHHLGQINLSGIPFKEQDFKHIPVQPHVRLVSLVHFNTSADHASLGSAGFQDLAQAFPNTERLWLSGCYLDENTLAESLRRFRGVKELSLAGNQYVEPVLKQVAMVKTLRRMNIERNIPAPIPLHLVPSLKYLNINGGRCEFDLSEKNLLTEPHPNIDFLDLQSCHSNQGIAGYLRNFPKLKTLAIYDAPSFREEDVTVIEQLSELRVIEVRGKGEALLPFLSILRAKRPDLQIRGLAIPERTLH